MCRRFSERRLDGLLDEPRPGTPRKIGDDEIAETIRLTLETRPPRATHWSLRSMAKAVGAVHDPPHLACLWQPHRTETRASAGAVRGREVADPGVGSLAALVADAAGQVERRTHDSTRHGTTSLFAALDIATAG
jgi:hypothetical protein